MSMVLTRSPLEVIGMNEGGAQKRRSARLSHEGEAEHEPPAKRSRANGVSTTTINTKQQAGDTGKAPAKKGRKVYDQDDEGFSFTKGKRGRPNAAKETVNEATPLNDKPKAAPAVPAEPFGDAPVLRKPGKQEQPLKPAQKKTRRRLPTTPEREVVGKVVRRSKRLSNENDPAADISEGPAVQESTDAETQRKAQRSPNPEKAAPLTVAKKRKHGANGVEEERIMTISLPFADTPVIRRNKEMRKNSAESHRRSSAGMRGKRASSLIDEGRGHALPHAEVPSSEFFKHISADLTEPRRMRCLLGWCGTRSLPHKPNPQQDSSTQVDIELQAAQTAHAVEEELAQDLISKGTLSDWFSRDDSVPPQIPLRKKSNPRNLTNAAKAEELEKELERLTIERAEWDEVAHSAACTTNTPLERREAEPGQMSPILLDTLDSPQRRIFEQLQQPEVELAIQPEMLHDRLKAISRDLEFSVDQFAHGIHALSTTRETAERAAEQSLADAARVLEERERQRAAASNRVDQMDVLRGLARVLNAQYR
ncbi:hypothetical protein DOTSEDRAFT_68768 [Dothistroma septosporum NZE10]|uniref:Uncharacterized protein n=1 Tax=Dothistroma septosporum (strain NZE10 / CBS 128990) TaxID=675120 RepID=N1Q440_DOTSN|nr:hypothetical protein DOTSEDRAFT_68768 [Dothistroma septosporum NZE10]